MSIAITVPEVTAFAPEFIGDSRISAFIDLARLYVSESRYGAKAKHAIILMTCHLLKKIPITAAASTVATGAISSEKVGEIQVSYDNVQVEGSALDQVLATTTYGQQFLMLKGMIYKTPFVV